MKILADLANVEEVIKDEALILLSSLLDDEYENFVLNLINSRQSLSYNEVSAALVNHELRKNDKKFFRSTSAEELIARGVGSNYKKGKRDFGNLKLVIVKIYRRINVLFAKKDTERFIVQISRQRRNQSQRPMSQWRMVMIMTHLYFHFLSPLLIVVQRNLSGFCIRALPITFVPNKSGLLVLKN